MGYSVLGFTYHSVAKEAAVLVSSLHEESYRELVQYLIEIRRKAKITQIELGTALGKPQSYVSKVETRERRIDLIEFTAWVRAVGTEPHIAYAHVLERIEK